MTYDIFYRLDNRVSSILNFFSEEEQKTYTGNLFFKANYIFLGGVTIHGSLKQHFDSNGTEKFETKKKRRKTQIN